MISRRFFKSLIGSRIERGTLVGALIAEAPTGATHDVTVNIDGVGKASANTGSAATNVLDTASDLSKQAENWRAR